MCDLDTSRIGAPYIYDISNLRVKKDELGGTCGTHGKEEQWLRGFLEGVGGVPERKILFGRPRLKWKDNIKIDRQEIGWKASPDPGCRPVKLTLVCLKCREFLYLLNNHQLGP